MPVLTFNSEANFVESMKLDRFQRVIVEEEVENEQSPRISDIYREIGQDWSTVRCNKNKSHFEIAISETRPYSATML